MKENTYSVYNVLHVLPDLCMDGDRGVRAYPGELGVVFGPWKGCCRGLGLVTLVVGVRGLATWCLLQHAATPDTVSAEVG